MAHVKHPLADQNYREWRTRMLGHLVFGLVIVAALTVLAFLLTWGL